MLILAGNVVCAPATTGTLCLQAGEAATRPALVRGVFVKKEARAVRVLVELSGETEVNHFTLADPQRIIVDLGGARTLAGQTISVRSTLVDNVRIGRPAPGVVRIVIGVRGKVTYQVGRQRETLSISITEAETSTASENTAPQTDQASRNQPPNLDWTVKPPASETSFPDKRAEARRVEPVILAEARMTEATATNERPGNDQPQNPPAPELLPKDATITVNERALTGPFSFPQQRGQRTFLPVVSIARALGDQIDVNVAARSVEVRRQNGVVAEFNAQLNQVRENGSVILGVSGTAEIIFPLNAEELMLPVEIVSALLDVAIIADATAPLIRITRGQFEANTTRDGAAHSRWQIRQAEYSYNLFRSASSYSQNFTLLTGGRLGDGRFGFSVGLDGGSGQGPLQFRRGAFTFERPNGERYIAGDFGTGTDLQFVSSAMRGLWAQRPLGRTRFTAWAGRALSDTFASQPAPPPSGVVSNFTPVIFQPVRARYDTTVIGSSLAWGPSLKDPARNRQLLFSSGAMYFNGPNRSGEILTGSIKYGTQRSHFQGDVGVGRFSGQQSARQRVNGFALLTDLSGAFSPRANLTFQVRYTHVGQNALSPQSGSFSVPQNLAVAGLNWRPRQWITTSFTISSLSRTAQPASRERTMNASLSLTPRGVWPTFLFSHTQGRSSQAGANAFTLVNVTKDFNRWRLFSNFSRIRLGAPLPTDLTGTQSGSLFSSLNGLARSSLTLGASVRLSEFSSLQGFQSFARDSRSSTVDWQTSRFFSQRVSFGAGIGFDQSEKQSTVGWRLLTSVQLPREQTLQFTYVQGQAGPQLLIELRGPLITRRRPEVIGAALGDLDAYSTIQGRVYQDVNLNGRFETGVDQPLAGVRLRLDSGLLVESDPQGEFRLTDVQAGQHLLSLDLLSVRADLTLLDSAERNLVLRRGRSSIVDFRLIRSGRITGMVWHDLNGNGKPDESEPGLADVRILTGSGRDTLTNAMGVFVLGDLPPGEHVIIVDQRSLPEGLITSDRPRSVIVTAGSETGAVNLPVITKPLEIKIREFPPARP